MPEGIQEGLLEKGGLGYARKDREGQRAVSS